MMLLILALLVVAQATASDVRLQALHEFLENRPIQRYSADFIHAADLYELDWKLLPCISIVETSGGKHVRRRNNIFGWNSGKATFSSVRAAIYHVSHRLAYAPHYRNKSTTDKLRRYNPASDQYALQVKRLMWRLGQRYAVLFDAECNVMWR